MNKLYQKDETWFAVVWILIYAVGLSICEAISREIGITSSVSAIFTLVLSAVLFFWIKRHGLMEKYGLCKVKVSARSMLYFIPLIIVVTRNFWKGFGVNMSGVDTLCYVVSMLCVGFIEEVLFRGFLFKGMSKKNLVSAVIVSSLTFALGHLAHLFDGSGVTLFVNLCQVFGAISFGFVCVAVFLRCGSIIPCILVHSAFDAFSAFANQAAVTDGFRLISAAVQFVIFVPYGVYLMKKAMRDADLAHQDSSSK